MFCTTSETDGEVGAVKSIQHPQEYYWPFSGITSNLVNMCVYLFWCQFLYCFLFGIGSSVASCLIAYRMFSLYFEIVTLVISHFDFNAAITLKIQSADRIFIGQ